jgi:hypothetical protein
LAEGVTRRQWQQHVRRITVAAFGIVRPHPSWACELISNQAGKRHSLPAGNFAGTFLQIARV